MSLAYRQKLHLASQLAGNFLSGKKQAQEAITDVRPSMFDTFAKLSDGRHNMQNNNLKAGGVLDFS